MTISQRFVRLAALAGAPLLAAGCPSGEPGVDATGFESDVSVVEVVSTNVQGKNVYIPSAIVVVGGRPQTLSLFNTTDIAHGFAIDGLGIETILQPGAEQTLELPVMEGGHVYRIHCHLHPPHRTATLVVLPGR